VCGPIITRDDRAYGIVGRTHVLRRLRKRRKRRKWFSGCLLNGNHDI